MDSKKPDPQPQQQQPHQQPASYTQIPYNLQQQPAYFQQRAFVPYAYQTHAYPPQQTWVPQPASFTPTAAQPLQTMVNQPQTNVPLIHNRASSQIVNPIMSVDLHQVPNQVKPIREKKLAVLRDPTTNQEVPLGNTTTSSNKSFSSIAKPSSNISSKTITSTTNDEHVHIELLQKVSEDNTQDNNSKQQQQQQPSTKPSTTVKTEANVNKTNELLTKASELATQQTNATISTSVTIKSPVTQKVASTPSVTNTTTTTTTTTTPSVPQEIKVNKNDKKLSPKVEDQPVKEPITKQTKQIIKQEPVAQNLLKNDVPSKMELKNNVGQEKVAASGKDESDKATDQTNSESVATKKEVEDDIPEVNDEKIEQTSEVNGKEKEEEGQDSKKEEEEVVEPTSPLVYETWQYNPVSNRSGKKIYSRQFMLDVCEKVCKLDLTHKENDDKIGMEGNRLQSAFSERIDLFAPSYSSSNQRFTTNRQNEPQRRQNQSNYAGRSSAGQEKQRKIITSASLTQEVELKTISNPWRPGKDVKEDVPANVVETEALKKKFRSILNKLTPNNFESLAEAVTKLNIDTETKLGEVIDIVFAKAIAEPGYCVLYGQMCSHLKKISVGAGFGNTLLKRCQNQFQSDIYSGLNLNERKENIDKEEDPAIKKQLNEELYEEMYRCRMRGLGLIKFIGELYKIEMLNSQIMFQCVIRLLSDTSEESLECLCDLLATIGEKLDRSSQKSAAEKEKEKKAAKSAPKANAYQGGQKSAAAVVASGSSSSAQLQQQKMAEQQASLNTLDPVFEQLHKIRKNKDLPLSIRIRFKLLDTCELREKENWQSKNTKDNNPKKIDEIREAHKEKLEQEKRQNAMGPRRSQEGRRGLGHSSGSSNQISSLANESGGNRGGGMHTSSSSHLLRDFSVGDNMKTNHNEMESQKEHQRQAAFAAKLLSRNTNLTNKPGEEPLRPNSQIYSGLRPMSGLSLAAQQVSPAATNNNNTTTTTTTSPPSSTTTLNAPPTQPQSSMNKENCA